MTDKFSMIELKSPDNDLLLPWLDLYETAFRPEEQMRVSDILQILKDHKNGVPNEGHIVALVEDGEFRGIVWYQMMPEENLAELWYLAVTEESRNRGIGAWAYNEIVRIARESGVKALVLEVEMPESAHTDEERALRDRRIEFYRRLGAKLLRGAYYTVGMSPFLPPVPMLIMFHPFRDITAEEAYTAAENLLGDTVIRSDELSLE